MINSEVERVYESFRVEFAGYARKALGGDEEAVSDAMQETLVRACMKQNGYEHRHGRSGMYGWLLAILIRVCREARRPRNPKGLVTDYDFEEIEDRRDYTEYDAVHDSIERDEKQVVLQTVIANSQLTNLEWAVVTATRLGFANSDIADGLGIGANTVRAHMSNALPRLRQSATSQGIELPS